jgi:diguanylate cyclase (GGDEF)-like protein/PAS domain S-box-containing protein
MEPTLTRRALDLTDTMVLVTDRKGRIVYVNPAFTKVTGYPADEAVGLTPRLLRSGAQDKAFYRAMWGRILSGRPWTGEIVNRRKDGTLYTDHMTITPILTDGEVTHFVSVKHDVGSQLAQLSRGSPIGIVHLDAAARLRFGNDRAEQLLGGSFSDLLGEGWLVGCDPATVAAVRRDVAATAADGVDRERDLPRDERWIRLRMGPLDFDGSSRPGVVATLQDITERVAARRELAAREALAAGVIQSLPDPLAVVDPRGVVVRANPAWLAADPEPVGAAITDDGPPWLDSGRVSIVRDVAAGRAPQALEQLSSPDGRWFELRVTPLADPGRGAVVAARDVTAQHEEQSALWRRATTDSLTGIANRAAFDDQFAGALARGRRTGESVTLLFLDLDDFKSANDAHGHEAGDLILRRTVARIASTLRESDRFARIGGDEFAILCEGETGEPVAALVSRLEAAVADPIEIDGGRVDVGVSVGIAVAPDDGQRPDVLLRVADERMYASKRRRQGRGAPVADAVPRG